MSQYFEEPGIFLAPAGTPFEEMQEMIRRDLFWGMTHGRGYMHMSDAQGELLYRVNAHIKGDYPGKPMNWRGL